MGIIIPSRVRTRTYLVCVVKCTSVVCRRARRWLPAQTTVCCSLAHCLETHKIILASGGNNAQLSVHVLRSGKISTYLIKQDTQTNNILYYTTMLDATNDSQQKLAKP